jgi:hypothetical protein
MKRTTKLKHFYFFKEIEEQIDGFRSILGESFQKNTTYINIMITFVA